MADLFCFVFVSLTFWVDADYTGLLFYFIFVENILKGESIVLELFMNESMTRK